MDGCKNYTVLNEADRAQGNIDPKDYFCDNHLTPGWYRFQGAAGDRMADKCVPWRHCGTDYTGWLSGAHPTVDEGVVVRRVCYSGTADCCYDSNNIKVKNCGAFYVYKLQKPPHCTFRYCGNADTGRLHVVGFFMCLSQQPRHQALVVVRLSTKNQTLGFTNCENCRLLFFFCVGFCTKEGFEIGSDN